MKLAVNESGAVDLATGASGLTAEDTLDSAVLVSLLTDRRALPDDRLPDGSAAAGLLPPDRRGWCGDALAETPGHLIGSRLWLLSREKQTEETRRRAEVYAAEALQWLLQDGHVRDIAIIAQWSQRGRLELLITLTLPSGATFSRNIETGGAYAV